MLRQEPDLEWLLAAPLPVAGEPRATLDAETFRRQAAAAFHEADYEEWGAGSEIGAIVQSSLPNSPIRTVKLFEKLVLTPGEVRDLGVLKVTFPDE